METPPNDFVLILFELQTHTDIFTSHISHIKILTFIIY